ncbi:MAG: dihydropteroate synthase [Burkholderiales bacterium]|nr:dihydropteroate synthase [Burkholderiales bacterium]
MLWKTTRFEINLATPKVMGIVNVTPDSFSDGREHANLSSALKHCELLLKQGADILDIGGESTRPGAKEVSLQEELQRVLPVVKEAVRLNAPISVDTYKPQVMQAVLDAGADIINDVWALRQKGALEVIAKHAGCGVCLMHMHAQPLDMQVHPMEGLAVPKVVAFLQERVQALLALGVSRERMALDPGIGFGKTVLQNFELLAHQKQLSALGYPLLVGWSRKSSLGAVTGCDVGERLVPSVAAALLAVERGAKVVRVHDVEATVQALAVWRHASRPDTLRQ